MQKREHLYTVGGNVNRYSQYGKQYTGSSGLKIYVHTHNGILSSLKKEENPATCNNMDESGGHYAK